MMLDDIFTIVCLLEVFDSPTKCHGAQECKNSQPHLTNFYDEKVEWDSLGNHNG